MTSPGGHQVVSPLSGRDILSSISFFRPSICSPITLFRSSESFSLLQRDGGRGVRREQGGGAELGDKRLCDL